MSAAVEPARTPVAAPAARRPTGWLVSPPFDLLLVANLGWPLVALLMLAGPWTSEHLSFVQVYFISTPHRWVTLALVLLDRDHFRARPARFAGLAVLLVALGLALVVAATVAAEYTPLVANPLLFLMVLDYAWNSWHFAAQHAGVARIYGRLARPDQPAGEVTFERYALRGLVLWVFVRWAVVAAGLDPRLHGWLVWADPVFVAPALVVLARELLAFRPAHLGRLLYVASVVTLYAGQVAAIAAETDPRRPALRALVMAGAVFHATEYLAVVGWSVQRKKGGVWAYIVPRTAAALLTFMAVLGVTSYLIDTRWTNSWMLATLLVSLLHYAYDGMIWRARPAARAVSPAPAGPACTPASSG